MGNQFIQKLYEQRKKQPYFIDRNRIEKFADDFYSFLFSVDTKWDSREKLIQIYQELSDELTYIIKGFTNDADCHAFADAFFKEILPKLYNRLTKDALFFLKSDPAAHSIEEIFLAYPGFYTITIYRIAHELFKKRIPLLPRMLTEYAHSKTGIDIHPGAYIGEHFFIDHGTGIVIGETSIIGNNVKLYQGVTLGALFVSKNKENKKRHPTIEDNVVIYSGATILGGETCIGHDSIIGGNAWIIKSVEPYSKVFHKGQIAIKGNESEHTPINFVI